MSLFYFLLVWRLILLIYFSLSNLSNCLPTFVLSRFFKFYFYIRLYLVLSLFSFLFIVLYFIRLSLSSSFFLSVSCPLSLFLSFRVSVIVSHFKILLDLIWYEFDIMCDSIIFLYESGTPYDLILKSLLLTIKSCNVFHLITVFISVREYTSSFGCPK